MGEFHLSEDQISRISLCAHKKNHRKGIHPIWEENLYSAFKMFSSFYNIQ